MMVDALSVADPSDTIARGFRVKGRFLTEAV